MLVQEKQCVNFNKKAKQLYFFCTNISHLAYKLISWEDYIMCEKVNFNVIEKNKYDNIDDITMFINNIVNKLIVNEFAKSVD